MHIKKIDIRRFAAIEDFEIEPTRLTVIRGDNDSGKTMLLDAILDALFSGRVKQQYPRALGRYKDAGKEVRIQVESQGREFSFPEGASLERLKNLPAIYVPNLLVIREGETAFHSEERLWEIIKENLSGMAGGLLKVIETIRDEVGITPQKNDWVSRQGRRLKEEVEHLRKNLTNLTQVKPKAEGLVRLQLERAKLEKKVRLVAAKLQELEAARKKEDYRKAVALERKYDEALQALEDHRKYSDADLEVWSEANKKIAREHTRKDGLSAQIGEVQEHISSLKEKLNEKNRQIDHWRKQEASILPDMEENLSQFNALKRKAERFVAWRPLFWLFILLTGSGAIISLVLGALRVTPFLFAALVFATILYLWTKHLENKLQKKASELSEIFRRTLGEKKQPEEVNQWIEEGRLETERARGEVSSLSGQLETMEKRLKGLKLSLEESEKALQESKGLIEPVSKSTNCPSLEDLEEKVSERRRLESDKDSLLKQIDLLLQTNDESKWEHRVSLLRPFAEAEGEWNEEEYERQRIQKSSIESEIERLTREIGQMRDPLIELGCRSPEDVWFKIQETSGRLAQYELKRKAALLAINIIEGLAQQQDALVNSIIEQGRDSASALLAEITAGYYEKVYLHEGKITVRRNTGKEFSVEELGTGARTQLYLAIRLSLVKRIFQDEPAFLLLDDPFTNCDDMRKRELIRALVKLSDAGWQIIYITFQKDLLDLFEEFAEEYPPGFLTVRHFQERLP
ncbi:MAG: hypothetical protein AMS15_04785 [Planctomycetes bacterium DG_23]|nr:MAG: hypothetical protein AMS15_04785 [Planctomycetes bacterium DG_23]